LQMLRPFINTQKNHHFQRETHNRRLMRLDIINQIMQPYHFRIIIHKSKATLQKLSTTPSSSAYPGAGVNPILGTSLARPQSHPTGEAHARGRPIPSGAVLSYTANHPPALAFGAAMPSIGYASLEGQALVSSSHSMATNSLGSVLLPHSPLYLATSSQRNEMGGNPFSEASTTAHNGQHPMLTHFSAAQRYPAPAAGLGNNPHSLQGGSDLLQPGLRGDGSREDGRPGLQGSSEGCLISSASLELPSPSNLSSQR